jgi:hypothetical protein
MLWGYSGGALATEWAAELQVQYAPELNFLGAVIGGVTPDIRNVFREVSRAGSAYNYLISTAMIGIGRAHPELWVHVLPILGVSSPEQAAAALERFQPNQLRDFVEQILSLSAIKKIIYRDGIMGYHGIPQMPLFVHRAVNSRTGSDGVSPTADTDRLVEEYCNMGATVAYFTNNATNHETEAISGFL